MNIATAQRRLITILFADLSDSTGIAAGLEPEHYADLLEQLRSIVEQVIPAHGGDVIRLDGDGVLAIFGHPDPVEDAGRRATEAALDLNAAMASLDAAFALPNRPLRLHCGIHAGLVLLRSGDMVRGKVEILGDATNTASRLCDAAGAGEILVSTETLGRDRYAFQSGEERLIPVSGHDALIPVLPVASRADAGSRFDARTREGLTPYQPRRLEELAFRDWLSSTSPLLLVHGPAGIGKSRFVRQMIESSTSQGWRIAHGYCESTLSARPLQPFLQIAQVIPGGAHADPARLEATIMAAARDAALLLVLDDWHWSDDASRDLLAQLAAGASGNRLKIILVSRETEVGIPPDPALHLLTLPPLGRDETLIAIEALLHAADPFAISRIEQASGGSPLLIEELCHAFASGTATPHHDPRGAWFDLAVQARFHRLGAAEQALLKRAAAIGHRAPGWLLKAGEDSETNAALLIRLQIADFLFPVEGGAHYRFKHGLTRDAIYAAIGLSERRALHAAVLDLLEAAQQEGVHGDLLDALAWHATAAQDTEKGLRYAVAAGDAALALGALDRAQAHYLAGFTLAETMPPGTARRDAIWALMNKFGLACIVDPAPDQLAVLARAQALIDPAAHPEDAIRCEYWQGSLAYGVGLGKRSVAHLQAALDLARASQSTRNIDLIEVKLAQSLCTAGRYTEGLALYERKLPFIRKARGRNDHEVSAYALAGYGFHIADQGEFARADALFREAEATLHDAAHPMNASSLSFEASACLWRGDWSRALQLASRIDDTSTRSRTRHQNLMNHAKTAYANWCQRRDPAALAMLERTASLFLTADNSHQRASMVLGWLIDVLAAQGERAAARLFMARLIGRVREGGDRLGEAMAWRALARMEQQAGAYARADRALNLARIAARARLSPREAAQNLLCAGECLLARGAQEAGHRAIVQARDAFAAMDMPWFKARAQDLASH